MGATVENYAEQARILSIQSEECAKRLQTLKDDVVTPTSTDADPLINRMSVRVIDTAVSVRSTTDSILSLYCHESLYETPSESQGEVLGTESMQVDHARVSGIIEDHIRKSAMVDEDESDRSSSPGNMNTSLNRRGSGLPSYVQAIYDYETDEVTGLSFRKGDTIQVLARLASGWWDGITNGTRGWFPSNYCVVANGPNETTFGMFELPTRYNAENEELNIFSDVVVDEDGLDLPLLLPSTFSTFKHSLDSSTTRIDEAIKDLKIEHSNHLAALELGIATNSREVSSDQHQYDSERTISGFF